MSSGDITVKSIDSKENTYFLVYNSLLSNGNGRSHCL